MFIFAHSYTEQHMRSVREAFIGLLPLYEQFILLFVHVSSCYNVVQLMYTCRDPIRREYLHSLTVIHLSSYLTKCYPNATFHLFYVFLVQDNILLLIADWLVIELY